MANPPAKSAIVIKEPENKYPNDNLTQQQFDEIFQTGSIASLTLPQRSSYLWWLADKFKLNPYTKPFDLIPGQGGKLIVYANRSASDQLRQNANLKDEIVYAGPLKLGEEVRKDVYTVMVKLTDESGRYGEGIGCVGIDNTMGEALANAVMKCHTKAMRRATLAFCGLGFPDETEVATIPGIVIEATAQPSAVAILPAPAPVGASPLPQASPAQAPAQVPTTTSIPSVVAPPKAAAALPRAPKILDGPKPMPSATPPAKV